MFPRYQRVGAPSAPPTDWLQLVNQPQTEAEVAVLRCCVNRGRPFGDPNWVTDTAERLGLNGRFGLVEDRRNNHKACHSYLYSPDLVAVTFTSPGFSERPLCELQVPLPAAATPRTGPPRGRGAYPGRECRLPRVRFPGSTPGQPPRSDAAWRAARWDRSGWMRSPPRTRRRVRRPWPTGPGRCRNGPRRRPDPGEEPPCPPATPVAPSGPVRGGGPRRAPCGPAGLGAGRRERACHRATRADSAPAVRPGRRSGYSRAARPLAGKPPVTRSCTAGETHPCP